MLLFFGGLYARAVGQPLHGQRARRRAAARPRRRDRRAAGRGGSAVELLGGGRVTREYRAARASSTRSTRAATDDRIKAVALDLDIFTGGGQAAIANVGEALDRGAPRRASRSSPMPPAIATTATSSPPMPARSGSIRSARCWSPGRAAPTSIMRGCSSSSASPPTSTASAPTRRRSSPSPAATCRPRRARPRRRWPTRSGRPGRRTSASARPQGAGRRLCRATRRASIARRRRRHGARRRSQAGPGRPDRRPRRLRPPHGRDRRRRRRRDVPGSYRAVALRCLGRRAIRPARPAARSASSPSPATIVDGQAGARHRRRARPSPRRSTTGSRDGDLKALVVRVDSPGGSVLASERIRRAVLRRQGAAACRW